MNVEREVLAISAENAATHLVFVALCQGLTRIGEPLRGAVADALTSAEEAASVGEMTNDPTLVDFKRLNAVLASMRAKLFPDEVRPKPDAIQGRP